MNTVSYTTGSHNIALQAQPRPASILEQAIITLGTETGILNNSLDALYDRLAPLLSLGLNNKVQSLDPPTPSASPVLESLHQVITRIKQMTTSLNDMQQRLEV